MGIDLPIKSQEIFIRVSKKEMAWFKFILEGFEGLAILSTIDSKAGIMRLLIPPGRYIEWEELYNSLKNEGEIDLEVINYYNR